MEDGQIAVVETGELPERSKGRRRRPAAGPPFPKYTTGLQPSKAHVR